MKKIGLIISMLAAVIVISGCSKSARLPTTVAVVQQNDETAKNTTIVLGDTFLVEMPGNMTTGHMWELAQPLSETAALALVEGRYTPGKFTYVMRTVHVGKEKLEFVYRRPSEKNKPPEKTFTVTVMVK